VTLANNIAMTLKPDKTQCGMQPVRLGQSRLRPCMQLERECFAFSHMWTSSQDAARLVRVPPAVALCGKEEETEKANMNRNSELICTHALRVGARRAAYSAWSSASSKVRLQLSLV
jgi:hypothetical protein